MDESRTGGVNCFKIWISRPEGMDASSGPIDGIDCVLICNCQLRSSSVDLRTNCVIHFVPFLFQHLEHPSFLRSSFISSPMRSLLNSLIFSLLLPTLLQPAKPQSFFTVF